MDTAGRTNISFEVPEFKILESDTNDKSFHKVAVIYTTGLFTLVNSFGEWLILAAGDKPLTEEMQETFTLKMQENLSVISYKEIDMVTYPQV